MGQRSQRAQHPRHGRQFAQGRLDHAAEYGQRRDRDDPHLRRFARVERQRCVTVFRPSADRRRDSPRNHSHRPRRDPHRRQLRGQGRGQHRTDLRHPQQLPAHRKSADLSGGEQNRVRVDSGQRLPSGRHVQRADRPLGRPRLFARGASRRRNIRRVEPAVFAL